MSYRTFTLRAGKPVQANILGKVILVDDLGGAEGLHITTMRGGQQGPTMPNRKKAFKCWADYDTVILQADVDCVVALFLSMTDVSLGFADGSMMNVQGQVSIVNEPDSRVPVDIGGGNVTVTADNVGISNDDANAVPVRGQALTNLVHQAASVIGTGDAVLLVADPTLRRLCIRNESAGRVALGGAGVTMANAAIILEAGDSWVEDSAAGATWFATSDTAGADVRVMGAK